MDSLKSGAAGLCNLLQNRESCLVGSRVGACICPDKTRLENESRTSVHANDLESDVVRAAVIFGDFNERAAGFGGLL